MQPRRSFFPPHLLLDLCPVCLKTGLCLRLLEDAPIYSRQGLSLWGGLTVRIGVNTGPVTGAEHTDGTGRLIVNVASRLKSMCTPLARRVPFIS